MKEQLLEYNIGKRHLANMMGEDPEHFTQEDVDVSFQVIRNIYIFFSLYESIDSLMMPRNM